MKKILLTVAAIAFVLSMVACGGAAATTTDETSVATASTATGDEAAAQAATINRTLSPLVIEEFPYMSAKKAGIIDDARLVRRVINEVSLPTGYKISIIGHNDANEKKNGVALQRAQAVFYELRALGVDAGKLKTKSATDTDMTSVENNSHPKQRRVTFKCELAR